MRDVTCLLQNDSLHATAGLQDVTYCYAIFAQIGKSYLHRSVLSATIFKLAAVHQEYKSCFLNSVSFRVFDFDYYYSDYYYNFFLTSASTLYKEYLDLNGYDVDF